MPQRKTPLVVGEIYHVFNRSIARQPIFLSQKDYQRAIEVIDFYRFQKLPLKFSRFKQLPSDQRQLFYENLIKNGKVGLEILAFCLMPNHFHFLLKIIEEKAISNFMNNFQHSYSKYFNIKNGRTGSLFQSMFKAVRIETDEQLIHVSRYIHLNPVSSFIIKTESLPNYAWSSLNDYISNDFKHSFISTDLILGHFKPKESYKEFVFDEADYQQQLEIIKHQRFD